jgi:hypothetical protein
MRIAALIAASLALVALNVRTDDEDEKPIPDDCPVTRPTDGEYTLPPPHKPSEPGGLVFLYGSDALFTQLYSDGRWRGIKSATGTRNKSAWFRQDAEWGDEYPYQLVVTAKRIDVDGPMLTVPRVTNMIVGKEAEELAMLIMLELPERGCWQVSGNYKSDYLSFVVWVE